MKKLLLSIAVLGIALTSCKKDYLTDSNSEREFIVKSDFVIENTNDDYKGWYLKATRNFINQPYTIMVKDLPKDIYNQYKEDQVVKGYVFVNFTKVK